MPYRAILFDLDGTLLNTLDDLADAGNFALTQMGFPVHPTVAYKYFIGDGVETLVRRALPADQVEPATVSRCTDLVRQAYAERWADKTRPYPGVPEMLDALCARRVPMAVLSNKPDHFTRLCVERLLPRWAFAAVVGAQPNLARKPNPAGALAIAAQLRVAPGEMIYLGDTNTDMHTAVAAGMYPVGALWGFRTAEELRAAGAQILIERPGDLLQILA
jgi:phosphoglycolate phosphatase